MQLILQRFYLKLLQRHSDKITKQKELDSFFKNIKTQQDKQKLENSIQQEQKHYQSIIYEQIDQSDRNEDSFYSFCGQKEKNNLDITFSPNSRVSSRKYLDIENKSYKKVILYAFLIDYCQKTKYGYKLDVDSYKKNQKQNAEAIMNKVKISMVSAANSLKQNNRKHYKKIRFLFQKLTSILEQRFLDNKQEYIKVIIWQFQQSYIDLVFQKLEQKYTKLCSNKQKTLQKTNSSEGFYRHKNYQNLIWKNQEPILNILNISLKINNKSYGQDRNHLHIQLEEMDNSQGYRLISMTNENKFSYYDNLFFISTSTQESQD